MWNGHRTLGGTYIKTKLGRKGNSSVSFDRVTIYLVSEQQRQKDRAPPYAEIIVEPNQLRSKYTVAVAK